MHLILTGATGLVGSGVLDAMIRMKDVTKITILSRRPVKMAEDAKDPRVNVVIHQDFEKYDAELLEKIKDATGCVWALGISQTQVGKQEYIKITKDFALAAAKAFEALSTKEPFHFVYVSGEGATFKPGPFTPIFGRVKGETELALAEMRKANPSFHAESVRPAFVDAGLHKEIKAYLPPDDISKKAFGVLRPLMRTRLLASWASPTDLLGQFLTEVAMGRFDGRLQGEGIEKVGDLAVVNNPAFRRLAALSKAEAA